MPVKQKKTRHVCPRNCYSTCAMIGSSVNGRLVKISGDKAHEYTKGKLCPKGYNYLSYVYHPERLKFPMRQTKRGSGEWIRISWNEAIDLICKKILELYDRYYTNLSVALNKYSGNFGIMHNSVEGFFNSLGQTSRAVGSPCWSSGLDAFIYDYGDYRNSDPEQLMNADVIVLWGANPVWTSIHSIQYLYAARERGAVLVVIDPVYTATAKKSDIYVQMAPGADGAFALLLAKHLLENNQLDMEFIAQHTKGFEAFRDYLNTLDINDLLKECKQSYEVIERIAQLFDLKNRVLSWVGFGFQRNLNGGQNLRAIDALMALTGNIGKEGTGVQYAQQCSWRFSNQILQTFQPGYHEANAIRPIHMNDFARDLFYVKDPPIKLLWISCRNLLEQSPDQRQLRKALEELEMIVTVDQFMTPTAQLSDIVLPTTTNFEEWDIVPSYWHHWISINEPAISPYYESKSDLEISCLLAKRLNALRPGFSNFPYEKTIEQFIEEEFTEEIYQLLGIHHWKELLQGPRRMRFPKVAWSDYQFSTPSGKFEFYSEITIQNQKPPIAMCMLQKRNKKSHEFLFLVNHGQFNLNSQFLNIDVLQNENKEQFVLIHSYYAQKYGIKQYDQIRVFNHYGEIIVKCLLTENIYPEILLFHGNHAIANSMIPFIPTDMGEVSSGYSGMAFNSNYVQIELVRI